jgi:alcohol dehydrogenase (NADP+)
MPTFETRMAVVLEIGWELSGVGGLGHFGVLWAKALGANKVVGRSWKSSKREDVLKLGTDEYISTDEDDYWTQKYSRTVDVIICIVSSLSMPIRDYPRNACQGWEVDLGWWS